MTDVDTDDIDLRINKYNYQSPSLLKFKVSQNKLRFI